MKTFKDLSSVAKKEIKEKYTDVSQEFPHMKMKYDDFEFTVLKKDGLGVNKILTAVVNLFTKKGEKTDADGFRHGDFKVERNQTKSFFNYLWINLKEGLVDTMMGRGKKKD